jgi:hypothetical protein
VTRSTSSGATSRGLPEAPVLQQTEQLTIEPGPFIPSCETRVATARRRRFVLLLLLCVGVLLRLLQYAVDRALWLDEALIVHSIINRSPAELLDPLAFGQTAPYGFLLLVWAAMQLLGAGEYALRLVPLLAGLTALLFFHRVARRYVSGPARLVALAVFALAPYLIYYASEVKQYSFDVLVALAVLWVAADLAGGRRGYAVAAATGVVAVWFSQPAIFVLAGTGLAIFAVAIRRGDLAGVRALGGVGAAWLASFAGSFAVSRRSLADAEYMQAFWRDGFMPLPPTTLTEWLWLPARFLKIFEEPLGVMGEQPFPLLGALQIAAGTLTLLVGATYMARRRPLHLAILGLPFLLMVAAAAVRAYPFAGTYVSGGRVLMFLIPAFALMIGEGAVRLARWRPASLRPLGAAAAMAAVAFLLLPSIVYATLGIPHVRAEVKPLLEYSAEQRRPGDVLYVYYNAGPQALYYLPQYGWTPESTVIGICSRLRPAGYVADVNRLVGNPRVWLLFVDGLGIDEFDERRLILSYLDHTGRRLDDQVSVGASLYLYDLAAGQDERESFSAEVPEFLPDPALDCRGPWGPP